MVGRCRSVAYVLAVVVALMASSCSHRSTSGSQIPFRTSTGPPAASTSQRLGSQGCRPTSPVLRSSTGFRQVHGTGHGNTLWGLLFFSGSPRVAKEVKIAWRMTGVGPFHIAALGPGGRRLHPAWGPAFHTGSDWHKPGQEWGTGFTFTAPGCWDLRAARRRSHADVWLHVAS
jgi:hypothetical protein